MRTLAVLVVFGLVGCVETSDPDALPPGSGSGSNVAAIDPSAALPCNGTISLVVAGTTPQSVVVTAQTYDMAGAMICLDLDARQTQYAHFSAETSSEPTGASSFQIALFDAGSTMLREGWDVSYGSASDPDAFSNVEYEVDGAQQIAVQLFVGAKAGSASTEVQLELFPPLE